MVKHKGMKEAKRQKRENENKLWVVTFSCTCLYMIYGRLFHAHTTGKQDIRDRAYILEAIEGTEYKHLDVLALVDKYQTDRERFLQPSGKETDAPVVTSQQGITELERSHYQSIDDMMEPQELVLKTRHLDYIERLIFGDKSNPTSWAGITANIANKLLDELEEREEYVAPVDDNSDMPNKE